MHSISMLKLLYLVSPALPIGAYAYSQGQEYAVDHSWLKSEQDIIHWTQGIMRHSLATTDAPVLSRAYDAWLDDDFDALNYWNSFLIAGRETKELLLEDEQLGQAFVRILQTHSVPLTVEKFSDPPSFPVLFALAGTYWHIPKKELIEGFIWSWLENQVSAATKTIPLGQTQAQRILMALLSEIPPLVDTALKLEDDCIGSGLPGLALASSLHERQYSRLFRS